jgi:hypothetical protein
MKYLIMQNGNLQLTADGWEVAGSAATIKAAKEFIREEALRYFEPDSVDEDFSESCMHYAIYELCAAVRPTPKINVSLTLKNIRKDVECL